jgi:archaeal flagellin FlaB
MRTFLEKFLKRIRNKDQEGITGLETAIILIAFVIVASVFAYVVLSAGLFSSQKAKEAVNAGLQSTMSTLEVKGNVIARMESSVVTDIYFCVGIPAAGSPVDFGSYSGNSSLLVISYADADNLIPSMSWTINKLSSINTDDILDPTELFQVDVDVSSSSNVSIGAYHRFSLEIKPADGPVLTIERTIPGRISQYVNLY